VASYRHCLVVAAALTACGPSGPPPRAPGSSADSYFPLLEGARWVYEYDLGIGSIEVEVEGRGEFALDGVEGSVFIADEHNRGDDKFGMVETAPIAYVVQQGYLSRITALDYDPQGKLRRLGREEPTWILPVPPSPGHVWSQDTRVFDLPDGGGGGDVRWVGEVAKGDPVRVPAGTFDDVIVVRIQYWEPKTRPDGPLLSYEDSYARGVGLVKSTSRSTLEGDSQLVEERLLRYQFPAR
jgi:hypothetical protein